MIMREPTNEKDENAVAVVRPKPDLVQTERAVDLHPNILNKKVQYISTIQCYYQGTMTKVKTVWSKQNFVTVIYKQKIMKLWIIIFSW